MFFLSTIMSCHAYLYIYIYIRRDDDDGNGDERRSIGDVYVCGPMDNISVRMSVRHLHKPPANRLPYLRELRCAKIIASCALGM